MAVVAAGELEDPVAARRGAGEPDRAHRRLGPGGHEPDELDGRHRVDDLLRQLDLRLRRGAEGRTAGSGSLDRRERLRIRVTEDERAPRHDPVDVAAAVHVLDARTGAAAHEDGLVEADGAHRPHRRVDAAGDHALGTPLELRALLQSHRASSFVQYEKTRSAPARLIDVSDSSAASRSSRYPRGGRRLHHRVLARDVVGGDRAVEALADCPDDVEVGQGRLDHQDVGALLEVELALAERLARVRGIHLVAAAVALLRRRLGHVAEGAVEGRRVLRGVGDDRRLGQRLADRTDAAVHHVARRDGVGARVDVRDRRPREEVERLVVHDLAVAQDAAVAVRGVLAEADVGDQDELRLLAPQRAECALDDPVVLPRARALLVLLLRDAEEEQGLDAEGRELPRLDARARPRTAGRSRRDRPPGARRPRPGRRRAASRSRRGRAASRVRATGGHPCGAGGAAA